MNNHPPKLPLRFLRWFCHPDLLPSIEGDLIELYEQRVAKGDKRLANWLLAMEVIKLFRPSIIRPTEGTYHMNHYGMFKNYFKVAVRNMRRNRAFTAINVFGLVLGMSAALLLTKFIGFRLSVDQFHEHKDNIYQIHQTESSLHQRGRHSEYTYWHVGHDVKEAFPEVIKTSIFGWYSEAQFVHYTEQGKRIKNNERLGKTVSPDFLTMFSFEKFEGNLKTALDQPDAIVLTETMAEKYFDEESAMGKTFEIALSWGEKKTVHVTAVVKDPPINSQFQFTFLLSDQGMYKDERWAYPEQMVFVQLEDGTSSQYLAEKMSEQTNAMELFKTKGKELEYKLEPLTHIDFSMQEKIMALIGFFLLVISWINYINLNSANLLNRGKETGIRRVLGAQKTAVVRQFVFEGFVFNGLALLVSLILVWLTFPWVEQFVDKRILPLFDADLLINGVFFLVFVWGALMCSFIPAKIVSSFRLTNALKGKGVTHVKGGGLRRALVVVQFAIALLLVSGVLVISNQMSFLSKTNLGVNLDRKIVVKAPKDGWNDDGWNGKQKRLRSFKFDVRELSVVESVTTCTTMPGSWYRNSVVLNVEGVEKGIPAFLTGIDSYFHEMYDVKFVAGSGYEPGRFKYCRNSLIINETAAKKIGYDNLDDIIGLEASGVHGRTYKIIGVVEDYHQITLKEKIKPMVFNYNVHSGEVAIGLHQETFSSAAAITSALDDIRASWDEFYPNNSFDYYFLDQRFEQQYEQERAFQELFNGFAVICLVIACLGLLGLTMFEVQKRTKEIGIRKVMGASAICILGMFFSNFGKLIGIAAVLAIPLAWLGLQKWLDSFAYHTKLSPTVFIGALTVTLLVALLTIGVKAFKAANSNPVESLRDE